VVNVFSCPQSGRTEGDHELERSGFTAMGWTDSSMQYWVVGDGDLRTLVSHLRHFKST
jgi:anti-sigma factor RsiW